MQVLQPAPLSSATALLPSTATAHNTLLRFCRQSRTDEVEGWTAVMRVVSGGDEQPMTVQLADVLGALSQALDLTEGQPVGHCVRATWIGFHIGKKMRLPDLQLWELYHTVMLKDLGCSSNAARICELYLSDDLSFKRDFKTVSDSLPKVLGFVFSHTGLKAGLAERFRAVLNILQKRWGHRRRPHPDTLPARGADRPPAPLPGKRLRSHSRLRRALERYRPAGPSRGPCNPALRPHRPPRASGRRVPHRSRPAAAMAEVRARSGTWFDPQVVACFEGSPPTQASGRHWPQKGSRRRCSRWRRSARSSWTRSISMISPAPSPRSLMPRALHLRPFGAGRGLRRYDRG